MLGLYFLGTSSGAPIKERAVLGIAVTLPEPKSVRALDIELTDIVFKDTCMIFSKHLSTPISSTMQELLKTVLD